MRWRRWQRDGAAQFDALVRAYRAGGPAVTPAQAGAVLAAMLDVTTRDVLATRWTRWWEGLGGAPDPDGELGRQVALVADGPPPDLDDLDLVEAVERLLVDLVVRAPDAAAPAPLTLLAMQSWAGGDGAAAGVAVDRALAIDPAYRMAALVDRLLRAGFAPRWVEDDRADDARPVSQHARRHLMPW